MKKVIIKNGMTLNEAIDILEKKGIGKATPIKKKGSSKYYYFEYVNGQGKVYGNDPEHTLITVFVGDVRDIIKFNKNPNYGTSSLAKCKQMIARDERERGTDTPPTIGRRERNGKVKIIRQLGSGHNVYFDNDTIGRINDTSNGKVIFNISDRNGETMEHVEFDTPEQAVRIAKKLQKMYPKGIPPALLIGRVIKEWQPKAHLLYR